MRRNSVNWFLAALWLALAAAAFASIIEATMAIVRKIIAIFLCVLLFPNHKVLSAEEKTSGQTLGSHENTYAPEFITNREHGVTEFVLANGARIIVKEVRRVPAALTQFWYRVGAADEYSGKTGISHLVEHMMFKGTEKRSEEELTQVIKGEGGRYNAFTSSDYTAYYELFAAQLMPLAFAIESDRIDGLLLPPEDFAKELEVVKEERRSRVDDNPRSKLHEQFYAAAFNNGPYHNPVIGWMDDLDSMTLADVRAWYQSWYVPNNAVVVVVGDVTPEAVYRQALLHLAPKKRKQLPRRLPRREAQQSGERRIELALPAAQPYLLIGYRAPGLRDEKESGEAESLAMLVAILSDGRVSRLYSRLVLDEGIAQSIGADYDAHTRFDDLLVIYGTPAGDTSVNDLENAIYREIEKLKTELVSERELLIARTRINADAVYRLDSIAGQARAFGSLESSGFSWKEAYDFPERLKTVSSEEVRAVARKYLIRNARTVAILKPEKISVNDLQK